MSPSIYTTLQGDTLGAVAKRHNLDWRSIFHARDNDELRELLRSPEVALPGDTPIWLTGGAPGAFVKTTPNQTLAQVCSANGNLSWMTVFEDPSNGQVRFLCVDPTIALRPGLEIRLPAPEGADAMERLPCAPGTINAFTLSEAGKVRVALTGTNGDPSAEPTAPPDAGASDRAPTSPADGGTSTPAAGDGEVPKDIQEQWRVATAKIVSRLGEMSTKLDAMSPPLPTKATLQHLLTSFGEMLSDPLQTVDEARVVRDFLDNDPIVAAIENSSLIEPKIEIVATLEPILARIPGVEPDEGAPASDADPDAADEAPTSPAEASDEAPTSPAEASSAAPAAGDDEVPKEIQEQWRAATDAIVGRLGEMSTKLDAMSPPLPTKATLQHLLTSFGKMLSDPLQTVDEARVVRDFLDNDPIVAAIESSSLIEPKIEIMATLEPILARIPGVAPDEGGSAPDADSDSPADD